MNYQAMFSLTGWLKTCFQMCVNLIGKPQDGSNHEHNTKKAIRQLIIFNCSFIFDPLA